MPRSFTKIAGGTIYDPANGVDGNRGDLWIEAGRIVAAPDEERLRTEGASVRTIDAAGMVVMPGGVDMHCHIAGPAVNAARRLTAGDHPSESLVLRTASTRGGTSGPVPSTFVAGYQYAGLGYTTAFDAAVPPLLARHAHLELADTPCIDKGFFTLVGNNHFLMRSIAEQQPERVKSFLAWILTAAGAYAPKLVNPGGVEVWKQQAAGNLSGLDERVPHFDITPRQILQAVTQAANELRLPHPVHIHCNNLGLPGNSSTTLETMRALEGHRAHLAHIQFHSYGGEDEASLRSEAPLLAEYVNSHPGVTVDVGQVMFGPTIALTDDSPLAYYLHRVTGGRWLSSDIELEAGCGVTPIRYRNQSVVHALQWAIGLEWYLLVEDPWRVAMSTDHPSGGSFLAYPEIIRLLMDRAYRAEVLQQCPAEVRERSVLAELDREYTLGEIAIITRAGPARILRLAHKGHLGPGADADVTIYTPHENPRTMFELPRMVIKAGEVLVAQGEIRAMPLGKTLAVAPEYDRDREAEIRDWIDDNYSVRFANYGIADGEFENLERVPLLPGS